MVSVCNVNTPLTERNYGTDEKNTIDGESAKSEKSDFNPFPCDTVLAEITLLNFNVT